MLRLAEQPIDPHAPIVELTGRPFRTLVRHLGAGLVVSQTIASREMLARAPSALARAEPLAVEAGTAVQIAGRDPEATAEACLKAGIGAGALDTELVEAA